MASGSVVCEFCRRRVSFSGGLRGRAGLDQTQANLFALGWTGSFEHGGWACSDDCRAYLARDVTPKPRALGPRR